MYEILVEVLEWWIGVEFASLVFCFIFAQELFRSSILTETEIARNPLIMDQTDLINKALTNVFIPRLEVSKSTKPFWVFEKVRNAR